MSWNPLVAQPGIVTRLVTLTQTGPDAWCRRVAARKELQAITEEMQVTPALYVVYDTFRVLAADEFETTLQHRWFVVLALKDAASQRDAAPLADDAGPLLSKVMDALIGFVAPGCSTPLILATPPRPYFAPATFAYHPLAFTHESYHCTGA